GRRRSLRFGRWSSWRGTLTPELATVERLRRLAILARVGPGGRLGQRLVELVGVAEAADHSAGERGRDAQAHLHDRRAKQHPHADDLRPVPQRPALKDLADFGVVAFDVVAVDEQVRTVAVADQLVGGEEDRLDLLEAEVAGGAP